MGALRRRLLVIGALVGVVAVAAGAYHFATVGKTSKPQPGTMRPTSVIGSGRNAVGVSADGVVLSAGKPPAEGTLPRLPLSKPPKRGRLSGPILQQARVLGAAPAVLRACIERSFYGKTGVDVKLKAGIELRFGNATRAAQKWSSAAAILADPSTTDIGYVDLHSPIHAATGGSGHSLPSPEPGSSASCGK
ncbi:MAG: cell division protein FtsQ/DivIB [Solirubrobacterales bacterium]